MANTVKTKSSYENLSSINVEQKIIFSVIAWITFLYLIVKKYRRVKKYSGI